MNFSPGSKAGFHPQKATLRESRVWRMAALIFNYYEQSALKKKKDGSFVWWKQKFIAAARIYRNLPTRRSKRDVNERERKKDMKRVSARKRKKKRDERHFSARTTSRNISRINTRVLDGTEFLWRYVRRGCDATSESRSGAIVVSGKIQFSFGDISRSFLCGGRCTR